MNLFSKSKQRIRFFSILVFVTLFLVSPFFSVSMVKAQVPQYINYQGKLKNSAGLSLTGTYDFRIRIYDSVTGGTLLYGDEHTGVTVKADGIFDMQVGTGTILTTPGTTFSSLDFSTPYYLTIEVGQSGSWDGEMTPRVPLATYMYSFNSSRLSGHSAGTAADDVLLLDSNGDVNFSGSIITPGNIQSGAITVSGTENSAFLVLEDTTNGVNAGIYLGNGNPENLVSANTGSLFFDESGELFLKESGTGNSGWVNMAKTSDILSLSSFWDTDNDTGIQVEESGDEDKIRLDTAGNQRFEVDQLGNILFSNSEPVDLANPGILSGLLFRNDKFSLRVGETGGDEWDDANIGRGSFASGRNNRVSGNYSSALGGSNNVNDVYSVALGRYLSVTSSYTLASGYQNSASGYASAVFGQTNHVSDTRTMAWGLDNDASAREATAFGRETTASAPYATSWGRGTNATGEFSTAFGYNNTASEDYGTAFGYENTADGRYATVWGGQNNVSGQYGTAWGSHNTASGAHSTAFGYYSEASAENGTAIGDSLANSNYMTAVGRFNENTAGQSLTEWIETDQLFVIGNGTGWQNENRHNAFTVLKNGFAGFGDSSPIANLVVGDDSGATYANGNGDMYVQNDLEVGGGLSILGYLQDSSGNEGMPGQILSSTAGGTDWIDAPVATSIWQEASGIISTANASNYLVTIENNSDSTLTGFRSVSTNDTHNYAGAVFEVKGSGPAYTNNMYFGKYSDAYYVTSWAGNGVMATDQDLVLTSAGTSDSENPNADPRILFQVGGGYTTPTDILELDGNGLAFTSGGSRINTFLDEDDFSSNSDTALATQQSIKSYVDGAVTASTNNIYTSNGSLTGNRTLNTAGYELTFQGIQYSNIKLNNQDKIYLENYYSNVTMGSQDWNMHMEQDFGGDYTNFNIGHQAVSLSSNYSSFAGIEYGADYSANFTDRSLVDKAYVDGVAGGGGSVSAASNGLTLNGSTVELGGSITKSTSINTNGYSLSVNNGNNTAGGLIFQNGRSSWSIYSTFKQEQGNRIYMQMFNNSLGTQLFDLTDANGFEVTDGRHNRGIVYTADYSANYTNRSLVDKAYVDSIAGGVPANNDGAIQYNNSGAFGGDSANFYWDSTNHRLGISNNAPTQSLDVNGNARFRVVGSGAYNADLNIMADGTLTTATSDRRLKKNIETIENPLKKVLALRGVTFNWKDENNTRNMTGMIAQEVKEVMPELVYQNPADGYYGINYGETVGLLVEAIKAQQTEIESVQEHIFAGSVVIVKGATTANVVFGKSYNNIPYVQITPENYFGSYAISERTEHGFTVAIEDKADSDIVLQWFVIENN